jgi:uncharacterized Zn finger protein
MMILKTGMVLDLQIEKGLVKSLIAGSGTNPFQLQLLGSRGYVQALRGSALRSWRAA